MEDRIMISKVAAQLTKSQAYNLLKNEACIDRSKGWWFDVETELLSTLNQFGLTNAKLAPIVSRSEQAVKDRISHKKLKNVGKAVNRNLITLKARNVDTLWKELIRASKFHAELKTALRQAVPILVQTSGVLVIGVSIDNIKAYELLRKECNPLSNIIKTLSTRKLLEGGNRIVSKVSIATLLCSTTDLALASKQAKEMNMSYYELGLLATCDMLPLIDELSKAKSKAKYSKEIAVPKEIVPEKAPVVITKKQKVQQDIEDALDGNTGNLVGQTNDMPKLLAASVAKVADKNKKEKTFEEQKKNNVKALLLELLGTVKEITKVNSSAPMAESLQQAALDHTTDSIIDMLSKK